MTKGIRSFAEQRFQRHLPKAGDMGPTGFRKRVMDEVIKQFNVSVASAATAYNYVLQKVRQENPRAVEGIGRQFMVAGAAANAATQRRGGPAAKKSVGSQSAHAGTAVLDAVTVVQASNGTVVAENITRKAAMILVNNSGGRGNPKLMIQEEEEAMA